MSIVNLAEQVGIVAGALKDDEAKGVDSGGDAGRLQKAGITASWEDGWPGSPEGIMPRVRGNG